MMPIWWLIPVFVAGAIFGLLLAALMDKGGGDDD